MSLFESVLSSHTIQDPKWLHYILHFLASRTALHLACSNAHKDIIIHLCVLHADVNVQDADGSTPMHKVHVQTHRMKSKKNCVCVGIVHTCTYGTCTCMWRLAHVFRTVLGLYAYNNIGKVIVSTVLKLHVHVHVG